MDKIKSVKVEITGCRECPYVSNSETEHDDPFTSAPLNIIWYCNHSPGTRTNVDIQDPCEIADGCPLRG